MVLAILATIYGIRAWREARRQNDQDASELLRRAHETLGGGTDNEILGAVTDKAVGDAASFVAQAARLAPQLSGLAQAQAEIAMHRGDFKTAIVELERLYRMDLPEVDVIGDLAVAYRHEGRITDALAVARRAVDSYPASSYAHATLARVFQARQDFPDAIAEYREAIRLGKEGAATWCNLGSIQFTLAQYDEAKAMLEQCVRRAPHFVTGWHYLGATLIAQSRYAEAERALRRAIDLNPKYASSFDLLSIALTRTGRLEEAADAAMQNLVLEVDPQLRAISYLRLALIQSRLGQVRNCGESLRKAIELDPHSEVAAAARRRLESCHDFEDSVGDVSRAR